MDFPTAFRYLLSGRTIRRLDKYRLGTHYRLGTIHETYSEDGKKLWNNRPAVLCMLVHRHHSRIVEAELDSDDLLAEDWEVVDE
jgi:hypothetical protein